MSRSSAELTRVVCKCTVGRIRQSQRRLTCKREQRGRTSLTLLEAAGSSRGKLRPSGHGRALPEPVDAMPAPHTRCHVTMRFRH